MGVAAVGAVTLTVVFSSTFLQLYRLEREAARLEQLQRDLEVQNAQLREEIKLLHTPQYIEKLAREQLGLVKPGEIALLLIQSPTDPSPRRPPSNGTDTPSPQAGAGRQPPPTRPGWVGGVCKVLGLNERGKLDLSVKQALSPEERVARARAKTSFEDKLKAFLKESEERLLDLKRNTEAKRGGGKKRK